MKDLIVSSIVAKTRIINQNKLKTERGGGGGQREGQYALTNWRASYFEVCTQVLLCRCMHIFYSGGDDCSVYFRSAPCAIGA